MEIKNSLVQLGLNKNEAAVYMALLKLGLTQAGPLVKATKLHRMLVYNALDKLVDEGFATVLQKKNIKLFQATDPAAFGDKVKRMTELVHNLVPQLRDLQVKKNDLVTVRTLVGYEGFITNLQDVVMSAVKQKDKVMRIIGGARDTDFYDAVNGWYDEYLNLLKNHGVVKKLLAPASYSTVFKKKFATEKNTELRTLPYGLSSPIYTRITEEMVAIEIYSPQIIVIQIRNEAIACGYLESFELLWKGVK